MSLFEYDQKILESINHDRIKSLDQFFISITDTAYLVALSIPIFILLFSLVKKLPKLKIKAVQMLASLAFNTVIVNIIKYTVDRQRPFELDVKIEKLSTGGSPSFPSGHTSDAFLMATCIMLLFGNKKWAIALVLSWAVFVAYSRIVLGVHYPSDVIGAILIGSANALIVNLGFANIKNNGKQIKHVWRK